LARVHPDLEQAIEFHDAIMAESAKALVGYETAKALANGLASRGRLLVRWPRHALWAPSRDMEFAETRMDVSGA